MTIFAQSITWAAGFVDGEGNFQKGTNGHPTPVIKAVQKNPELLYRLKTLFGGYVYEERETPYWVASGARAIGIMMTLYGFMSQRRKEQICGVLNDWRSRRPSKPTKPRKRSMSNHPGRYLTTTFWG
jgi:hypothetical protein